MFIVHSLPITLTLIGQAVFLATLETKLLRSEYGPVSAEIPGSGGWGFEDARDLLLKLDDIIDVENESMKTPSPKRQKTQLQKVFDLSKDSAEATYHWMRCVFTALHSINILLYIDLFCLFAFSHVFEYINTVFNVEH